MLWASCAQVQPRLRGEQVPLPTAQEQGLCVGACFTIAVGNKLLSPQTLASTCDTLSHLSSAEPYLA